VQGMCREVVALVVLWGHDCVLSQPGGFTRQQFAHVQADIYGAAYLR
jgi:hypothetical protein